MRSLFPTPSPYRLHDTYLNSCLCTVSKSVFGIGCFSTTKDVSQCDRAVLHTPYLTCIPSLFCVSSTYHIGLVLTHTKGRLKHAFAFFFQVECNVHSVCTGSGHVHLDFLKDIVSLKLVSCFLDLFEYASRSRGIENTSDHMVEKRFACCRSTNDAQCANMKRCVCRKVCLSPMDAFSEMEDVVMQLFLHTNVLAMVVGVYAKENRGGCCPPV